MPQSRRVSQQSLFLSTSIVVLAVSAVVRQGAHRLLHIIIIETLTYNKKRKMSLLVVLLLFHYFRQLPINHLYISFVL